MKSIVQPVGVGIVVSPHYALYSDDYYAVDEKHRHVPGAFSEFSNEIAQINHYQTKNFEEWLDKVKRGIADSNFNRRKVEDFWHFNSRMLDRKEEIMYRYRHQSNSNTFLKSK